MIKTLILLSFCILPGMPVISADFDAIDIYPNSGGSGLTIETRGVIDPYHEYNYPLNNSGEKLPSTIILEPDYSGGYSGFDPVNGSQVDVLPNQNGGYTIFEF